MLLPSDAVAGCNDLTYNITTGLPNVAGARYILNVGFQPGAFVFLNQTEGNMYVFSPSERTFSRLTTAVKEQPVFDSNIKLAA